MPTREVATTEIAIGEPLATKVAKRVQWPLGFIKIPLLFLLFGMGMVLGAFLGHNVPAGLNFNYYSGQISIARASYNFGYFRCVKDHLLAARLKEHTMDLPLEHSMTDAELLWLSSIAPLRPGLPIRRVPKVAFMFLVRGPLPLAPLWEKFFANATLDHNSIYVHSSSPNYTSDVPRSSVFFGRQIPSQESKWGDISLCDAERRLLANALLDFSNERFVLLSETCIPLHPFHVVYSYLMASNQSYVASFDEPGPYGRGRYDVRMSPVIELEQWRKGSQWFEMNRKLAIYTIADTHYYPRYKDFCKPGCYVDEHYLQTMLSIEFPLQIANRSITWVDWSRGGPHPAMFGGKDVTEAFLSKVREQGYCTYNGHRTSLCFLFARKFAPNALKPLLELAPKVMGI